MVLRQNILCLTCKKPLTLRISIGYLNLQEHSFFCPNCQQEIKIALHIDHENVQGETKYLHNCLESDIEGTIINLDPQFVFAKNQINKDSIFNGLAQSFPIIEKMLNENPRVLNNSYESAYINKTEILANRSKVRENWLKVKKAWELSLENQNELSQTIIDDLIIDEKTDIHDLIYRFF